MYFPIGWPKYYNSKEIDCGELLKLKYNRDRSLLAVISRNYLCLWCNKPRVLIISCQQSDVSSTENGDYVDVAWKPDSCGLVVSTSKGRLLFYDVEVNYSSVKQLYRLKKNGIYQDEVDDGTKHGRVPCIQLTQGAVVPIVGGITSMSPRRDELFVCTGLGMLQRIRWNGLLDADLSIPVYSIPFFIDLQTTSGVVFHKSDITFRSMVYSPLLGGFAVVLDDGRGAFLSAASAAFEPTDIIGVWAKDLTTGTCVAVNQRYRLLSFGCSDGRCLVYTFDELTGGLQLSHTLVLSSKDYPDTVQTTGGVECLSWTPDGCAIAVAWTLHGGLSLWSVFGSLLMCTLSGDYGLSQDAFLHNPLLVKSMDWGPEGYNLVMVSDAPSDEGSSLTGDILQLQFVKSALTVNPCVSNHQHLFLQGEDCLYLNTVDMVSETTNGYRRTESTPELAWKSVGNLPGTVFKGGPSSQISNKQWQVIQIPPHYLKDNWPVRYAAVDSEGLFVAVAGRTGLAHYSVASRKWKLFGNISQERNISCRGGLAWWKDFLLIACCDLTTGADEFRVYPRANNLDNAFAQVIRLPSPAFLLNVFSDLLIVYCSDCRVIFFSLERKEINKDAVIQVTRLQETSLSSYVPHPLAVIHLTFSSLFSATSAESPSSLHEVESLIVNVAGRLLMFQREKTTTPDKKQRKVGFGSPVVLASTVENVWASSTSKPTKRHLMEALWLGCGAAGMKVWVPLFPGDEEKPPNFLSKRIMLPFSINIYPLAVLFEDAVLLGAEVEPMPLDSSCSSPVSLSPQPFPFCMLERTTQIYLHHVLRQLLKRNLGTHALQIARSCSCLPYFPHVLELMLHEVLEEEATASEPIPDAQLPQIVAFIQEFPEYLQTVVHCARKTEVALWPFLFSVVGDPGELFKNCLDLGLLETAASYLIILQNLEQPDVSKQHATILLDAALDNNKWEVAKDLARFLRNISLGELDSPPLSPTHKMFHPPSLTSPTSTLEEDDLPLVFMNHPRTGSVTRPTRLSLTRMGTGDKAPITRVASLDRPGVRKSSGSRRPLNRSASVSSDNYKPSSPREIKKISVASLPASTSTLCNDSFLTPEEFFIDTILNRHARKLICANRLRDLGKFSAHLEFNLVAWLHKERSRAAQVEDFLESFVSIHKQFDWPYPSISSITTTNTPMSPKALSIHERHFLSSASQSGTPPELPSPDTPANGIPDNLSLAITDDSEEMEAYLTPAKSDTLSVHGNEASETSSVTYSMDGEGDTLTDEYQWINDLTTVADPEELGVQLNAQGSQQAERELRYLLEIFVDAECSDWAMLLAIVLRDLNAVCRIFESVIDPQTDPSAALMPRLREGLSALDTWAENECQGYKLFFSLLKVQLHNILASNPESRDTGVENHCKERSSSETSAPSMDNVAEEEQEEEQDKTETFERDEVDDSGCRIS